MTALPSYVQPERKVRTPSGAIAEVVAVYAEEGEALVKWPNGQMARFRVKHLRGLWEEA